jgi:hypothetical protein
MFDLLLEIVGRVFNFAQTVRTPCLIWMRSGVPMPPLPPTPGPGLGWKNTGRGLFPVLLRKQSFVWAHGRRNQIVIVTTREVVAALKDLVL